MDNFHKKKQVNQVLSVLGSSVLAAILISAAMLYFYNPSSHYLAEKALLSPKLAGDLRNHSDGSVNEKEAPYLFSDLEYAYFDKDQGLKRVKVSNASYQKFYEMISGEESLSSISEEISHLFLSQNFSTLSLTATPSLKNSGSPFKRVHQEVQFASEGDYYRIQLLENKQEGDWIYFYHPHVKEEVMRLFL